MERTTAWEVGYQPYRMIDRVVSWRHSLVADGGAGLIIIGQDGSADAEISVVSRFLFVQSKAAA